VFEKTKIIKDIILKYLINKFVLIRLILNHRYKKVYLF